MAKTISITKVGVGSLGKLIGSVNAIVALVIGILSGVVTTVSVISNNNFSILVDVLVAVGIALLSVVIYPLVGFVFGWLYGALIAVVWNLFLGVSGGLQIDTEEQK